MSLLPVDLGELINRPANGLMRDESDQVPNFTDHLEAISRDLIFKCHKDSHATISARL